MQFQMIQMEPKRIKWWCMGAGSKHLQCNVGENHEKLNFTDFFNFIKVIIIIIRLPRLVQKNVRNGPKRSENGPNPTKTHENGPFGGWNSAPTGQIFAIRKLWCHQFTSAPQNAVLTFAWMASQTPFPTTAKLSVDWTWSSDPLGALVGMFRIGDSRPQNVAC